MFIVDSHCHLFYEGIVENLDDNLKIARENDIKCFLSVSTSLESIDMNKKISNTHDDVFYSVGIHPTHYDSSISHKTILPYIHDDKVVAIGEVGLDYFYDKEISRKDQEKLLREMFEISNHTTLPYIFHSRDCFPDIFDIMDDYKNLHNGVFHCYTGDVETAKIILDKGFYISFSGIITFKNAGHLIDVARYIPDDRFLVETDSPYLTPVPYRGRTNKPSYVKFVADKIAEIKNKTLKEIASITTNNFKTLFNKTKNFIEDNNI